MDTPSTSRKRPASSPLTAETRQLTASVGSISSFVFYTRLRLALPARSPLTLLCRAPLHQNIFLRHWFDIYSNQHNVLRHTHSWIQVDNVRRRHPLQLTNQSPCGLQWPTRVLRYRGKCKIGFSSNCVHASLNCDGCRLHQA